MATTTNVPTGATALPSPSDIWRLSRLCAGVADHPLDAFETRAGILAAAAIRSANGHGPDAALQDFIRRAYQPGDGESLRLAIFGADPLAPAPTEEAARPRYVVRWAADSLEPQAPLGWHVEKVSAPGTVTLWVGAPATVKTYSLLDLAVHVAAGAPDWLGFAVQPGRVLLVDEESGTRRVDRRLAEVMRAHGAGADLPLAYVSLAGFNLRDPADVEHLDRLVADVAPSLVIIDALVDIMPGADENKVSDTQPVFLALRRIAEARQVGVHLIHHANRAGDYRGSSAINGAVDLMLKVERAKTGDTLTFTTVKTRDVEPFAVAVKPLFGLDGFDRTFDLDLADAEPATAATTKRLNRSQEYVYRYLMVKGPAGMDELMSHADACSPNAARQAVYALAAMGAVKRTDDGTVGQKATYGIVADGTGPCIA